MQLSKLCCLYVIGRTLNTSFWLINSNISLTCQFCCIGFPCKSDQIYSSPQQKKKKVWPCWIWLICLCYDVHLFTCARWILYQVYIIPSLYHIPGLYYIIYQVYNINTRFIIILYQAHLVSYNCFCPWMSDCMFVCVRPWGYEQLVAWCGPIWLVL